MTTICSKLWGAGQSTVCHLLRTRPVPQHVAFIMDGNRRYAEARQLRSVEGHGYGYAKLLDALQWCLDLGITCVSVYAFSIDNFQRSAGEVSTLMDLAETKFLHMLERESVLQRHRVRVRIVGRVDLLPRRVRAAAARVVAATACNDGPWLNICFAYSASEEMLTALESCESVDEPCAGTRSASFQSHLRTDGCPDVDLVIRTSGEDRLSDFLLWQSRHALLVFSPDLWPDLSYWQMVRAILHWQSAAPALASLRAAADVDVEGGPCRTRAGTSTHDAECSGCCTEGSGALALCEERSGGVGSDGGCSSADAEGASSRGAAGADVDAPGSPRSVVSLPTSSSVSCASEEESAAEGWATMRGPSVHVARAVPLRVRCTLDTEVGDADGA